MSGNNVLSETKPSSRTTPPTETVAIMLRHDPLKPRWSERENSHALKPRRQRRTLASVFLIAVASIVLVAGPAWAHGGQSATEGYVMVQQAIAYLVNEPGPKGTAEALVRVDNALAAKDQDGVDVPTVAKAQAQLKAGNADAARPLLQDSISAAIAALKPAVGDETGTTTVVSPLQGNGALTGMDSVLLILSVVVALGGAGLAYLFHPRENLAALGRDIRAAAVLGSSESRIPSSGRDDDVR
jgi:hypothetical protein